jgi:NADH-quinone oxidoreductase subunit G
MSDIQESSIELEIDGQTLRAQKGAMVIEVADEAGIRIPRFCYHKKLPIAANCRMCLVEVEKAPKPLPACATPVMPGMKVKTRSPMALEAQKSVMEFLLINHPLDCPICDQGGQCELQDVAMGFGQDISRYTEAKRVVKDKNLGSLIATDMTRCIHCTRCVRFGQDVANIREMGATGRGEFTQIGTYIEKSISSELSGNIIDLCPVGALTSKPFRFKARAWELKQSNGVSTHDILGSNLYLHAWRNQVMRVVPRENEQLNEVWLSDRDRYSYEGLNSPDRLQKPMIKSESGEWQEVDWHKALTVALEQVQKTLHEQGPAQIGSLISPNASIEEHYLLQKFCRDHEIGNIDHRVFQQNNKNQSSLPSYPSLGITLEELEKTEVIVLIGTNIHKDIPLLGHRIVKAVKNGAKVIMINPAHFSTNFKVDHDLVYSYGEMIKPLAGILKASGVTKQAGLLSAVNISPQEQVIAELMAQPGKKAIFLGPLGISHPNFDELYFLATEWAKQAQASFGLLSHGGNSAGAYIAGAIPDPAGLCANEMFAQSLKTYLLYQIDPLIDSPNPGKTKLALSQAESVIAFTSYVSETLKQYATVLLPVVPYTETAGTYVNAMGQWQTVDAAVTPLGEARPGWKVLRVLGNLFKLDGFDYQNTNEILAEVKLQFANKPGKNLYHTDFVPAKLSLTNVAPIGAPLVRVAPIGLYQIDNITRRAAALQNTPDNQQTSFVYLNKQEAVKRELFDGHPVRLIQPEFDKMSDPLLLKISDSLPDGVVLAYHGLSELNLLGGNGEWVDVQPVDSSIA